MGLKQRKRQANEYALGKEWTWNGDPSNNKDGFKQRLNSAGGSIGTNAVNFVGATMNSFGPTKSEGELMQESGQSVGYGSGFSYQRQNNIETDRQLSELSKENTANTLKTAGAGAALGATVGSIVPGLGTVIGGVVGGIAGGILGITGAAKRRRQMMKRIANAQRQVQRVNDYSMSGAYSDYLQNQYYQDNEYTQDDQIFAARHGKDLKQPIRQNDKKSKNSQWT